MHAFPDWRSYVWTFGRKNICTNRHMDGYTDIRNGPTLIVLQFKILWLIFLQLQYLVFWPFLDIQISDMLAISRNSAIRLNACFIERWTKTHCFRVAALPGNYKIWIEKIQKLKLDINFKDGDIHKAKLNWSYASDK